MVRGIPVSHWQVCFDLPYTTYIADYYYSRNTWNYAASSNLDMYDTGPIMCVERKYCHGQQCRGLLSCLFHLRLPHWTRLHPQPCVSGTLWTGMPGKNSRTVSTFSP